MRTEALHLPGRLLTIKHPRRVVTTKEGGSGKSMKRKETNTAKNLCPNRIFSFRGSLVANTAISWRCPAPIRTFTRCFDSAVAEGCVDTLGTARPKPYTTRPKTVFINTGTSDSAEKAVRRLNQAISRSRRPFMPGQHRSAKRTTLTMPQNIDLIVVEKGRR